MTITVSSEIEERLVETAARRGEDPLETAESLLRTALRWEEADHAEAIEGIRLGLEDSDAGRVRPTSEFFADLRAKMKQKQGTLVQG